MTRTLLPLCLLLTSCSGDADPVTVQPPCTAPPGFTIAFNAVSKHYSWCAGAFCPRWETYSSRTAALAAARRQYEYSITPHEKVYDPDEDEDNWRRIENPCDTTK